MTSSAPNPDIVFSPTETIDFLRCGIFRQLRKQWEPRGDWVPNRLLGTAIAAALDMLYKEGTEEDARQRAEDTIRRGYVENSGFTLDGVLRLAEKGLNKALEVAEGVKARETVVGSEVPLLACRPDLITRVREGLVVTDGKVTMNLDARYRDKRLQEYDSDFQFWHYAWAVEQHYGEPVAWVRVHMTVLNPAKSFLHPIRITPERVAFWLQGAKQAWLDMQRPPAPNMTACYGKYGRCIYYTGCNEVGLDRMDQFFDAKEPSQSVER